MIVPSMTLQEIHREFFTDLPSINAKIDNYVKDFQRRVLKASNYPYSYSYDCYTKPKRNLFLINFTTLKRSGRDNPFVVIYGIYGRPEGKYAASLSVDMNLITVYPPHFFKRYRERIVKNDSMSNNEIIKHFLKQESGFVGSWVKDEFDSVYHSLENDDKDAKISFVAVSPVGYYFGSRQGNINLIKTVITQENLFENQKPIFEKLQNDLNIVNKQRFGNDYSEVDYKLTNLNK